MLKTLESYGTKSGTPCAKAVISDCGEVIAASATDRAAASGARRTMQADPSIKQATMATTTGVISSGAVLSAEGQRLKDARDAARQTLQKTCLLYTSDAADE